MRFQNCIVKQYFIDVSMINVWIFLYELSFLINVCSYCSENKVVKVKVAFRIILENDQVITENFRN